MKTRFLILSLLAAVVPAAAEDTAGLTPSDTVRVALPGASRFQATVLEVEADTLLVRVGEGAPRRLPLSGLQRLEVVRGRRGHMWQGALIGFLPGFALGAYAGNALGCDDQGPDCTDVGAAAGAGLLLGAASAAVGGLVGLAIRGDRWEGVALPGGRPARIGAAVVPVRGGVAGGLRLSF